MSLHDCYGQDSNSIADEAPGCLKALGLAPATCCKLYSDHTLALCSMTAIIYALFQNPSNEELPLANLAICNEQRIQKSHD